jgi:hypothetical protein
MPLPTPKDSAELAALYEQIRITSSELSAAEKTFFEARTRYVAACAAYDKRQAAMKGECDDI